MKKILIFTLIFAQILIGADFRDDTFKLNLQYDEDVWQVKESEKFRDRLVLKHISLPATINILAYRFAETITANGLVQRRIQSVYDGWQRISEQPIINIQARQKNISEGIRSIYRKIYLDDNLNEQKQFVGDICLVTDDTLAIILNVTAKKSSTLLKIKDDFNSIYSTFWYGDQKPLVNFVNSNEDSWIRQNQNFTQRRYIQSSFSLRKPYSKLLEYDLPNKSFRKDALFYYNENGQYVLEGDELTFFSAYTNDIKSIRLNLYKPQIQLKEDGFYAIQYKPELIVKKYDLDFNESLLYIDSVSALDGFIINDYIASIESDRLRFFSPTTEVWSYEYPFKEVDYIVNIENLIIADKNDNRLLSFNINTGELKSTITLTDISPNLDGDIIDFAMNQGKLLLTMRKENTIIQTIVNPITAILEDQMILENIKNFNIIGITNDLIVVKYKTDLNESYLQAFDFNTFASVWKRPFNNDDITVLTNNDVLFFNNKLPQVSYLDLVTSTNLVTQNMIEFFTNTSTDNDELNIEVNNFEKEGELNLNLLKLLPLKTKLMGLVEIENKQKLVFLGNIKN